MGLRPSRRLVVPTYHAPLARGEVHDELSAVRTFLTAEWRHLVMLNYRVAPELLESLVPAGTELDTHHGIAYVSLVAFMFSNTRVLGASIPLHRTFEEVNLRLYVRRTMPSGELRRGVVFIREIVPRLAIALVARAAYNEPYVALPMRHEIAQASDGGPRFEYRWRAAGTWHVLSASASGRATTAAPGSLEEFITEHYWGYTRQRDGRTVEYQVTHPRWNVCRATTSLIAPKLDVVYGDPFAAVLRREPDSALLADGSPVAVGMPKRLARAITP